MSPLGERSSLGGTTFGNGEGEAAVHGVALGGLWLIGGAAWCRLVGGCLLVRGRRRSQPRMAWLYAGSMTVGAFLRGAILCGLRVGQAWSAVPATHGVGLRGVHDCGGFLRGAILCGLPVGQASSVAPAMHDVALRGGTTVGLSWRGAALGAVCWPGVVGGRSHARRGSTGVRLWGFPRVVPTWGAVCWSGVVGGPSHAWRGSTGGHDCGAFPEWCHPGGCLLVRHRRRSQPRMAWV